MSGFPRDTLGQQIQKTTEAALASGALQSIPTRFRFLQDRDISFIVRVVERLARKPQSQSKLSQAAGLPNPFLPYDQDMFVADVSDTHVCLLNKFNVVENHVLIVTREFEHQLTPLTYQDFAALWRCMAEYNALGFYNAGAVAGASQSHKHLQMVPLPLAPGAREIPLATLVEAACEEAAIGVGKGLPFRHAAARLAPDFYESPAEAATTTLQIYHELMRTTGLTAGPGSDGEITQPYNLLVTRQWIMLVPRSSECFEGISLNALAFAGALLVRDEAQLKTLQEHGPMRALQHVAGELDQPGS